MSVRKEQYARQYARWVRVGWTQDPHFVCASIRCARTLYGIVGSVHCEVVHARASKPPMGSNILARKTATTTHSVLRASVAHAAHGVVADWFPNTVIDPG